MLSIPSAMQSARSGLQRYGLEVDRAAEAIARSFELDVSALDPVNAMAAPQGGTGALAANSAPAREPDYLDSVMDMMLAQRAFTAQLRVIEAADQMTVETLNLERSPPPA